MTTERQLINAELRAIQSQITTWIRSGLVCSGEHVRRLEAQYKELAELRFK